MSKRKKTTAASPPTTSLEENESVTTRAVVPSEVMKAAMGGGLAVEEEGGEDAMRAPAATDPGMDDVELPPDSGTEKQPVSEELDLPIDAEEFDAEMTVNLAGDLPPGRDDLDAPTVTAAGSEQMDEVDRIVVQRKHLRGLLEALVFASDSPIKTKELAKLASAHAKLVTDLLGELKTDFATRGIHLDEVAGGWVFRTSPQYAPFVRDLTKQKPVRLTRAQVETLAIIAYRQPITRPEVDDVRGVDSGPVLKLLLERDLVRILGKRDEPGRPLIYGTTGHFLEFFGLKSLKDLPTLREFTELSDESREAFEDELGETPEDATLRAAAGDAHVAEGAHEELGAHEAGSESDADRVSGAAIPGELESTTELDDDDDGDIPDERAVRESMSVPRGEEAADDLGDDDLELLEDEDGDVAADRPSESGAVGDPSDDGDASDGSASDDANDANELRESSNDVAREPHAADDDGPTLTSEAPSSDDD